MTFIDWSDGEGLLDLLVEFIRDAKNECSGDMKRERFMANLLSELNDVNEQLPIVGFTATIVQLRRLYDSIAPEFLNDPALSHIEACIGELERFSSGAA